ncbi:DUF2637 domain-containing protein [Pseudolysinimonas sp.]|uniref:DUF2637 domain-containing protein n=1 Tax=Pseudolysinimonas sp. TaxID=2680009 RepID=UPI003F7D7431
MSATETAPSPTEATVTALENRDSPRVKRAGDTRRARQERAAELRNVERQRRAAQRAAEGSKPALRFSAAHAWVLITLLVLAAFMAIASFVVSFDGLAGAALWAVGDTWLRFAVPAMFDVAILVFTLKLFRDREEGRKVRWSWFWIAVLATVSAGANILHTISISPAQNQWQLAVGCVIAGAAPFLLALVSDVAADQVFRRPDEEATA